MTDVVSVFRIADTEFEVPSLAVWDQMAGGTTNPEIGNAMQDYTNLVEVGYREVFKIE